MLDPKMTKLLQGDPILKNPELWTGGLYLGDMVKKGFHYNVHYLQLIALLI